MFNSQIGMVPSVVTGRRTLWLVLMIFATVLVSLLPSGSIWLFERTLANAPAFSFPDCYKVGHIAAMRESRRRTASPAFRQALIWAQRV